MFTVTNQGTQPVYVWAQFESFGNGAIWLYPGSDDGTKLRGDDSVIELPVADTVHMGVHIDTHGVNLGTTTVDGTIHANAKKPADSGSENPQNSDPYAPTAPNDYVSYYPLDGDAIDHAGSNDGTPVGGVSYESSKVGEAAVFDDSGDQHIELADGSTFGDSSFTVAAWAKVDAQADQGLRTIIARQTKSGTYTERTFVLWFDVGNAYFGAETLASRLSDSGQTRTVTTDENYTDGDWHHVTMTVDGGNEMKLYVDGIEQGSQSLSGDPFTGDAPTWLGQEPGRDDRPLDGNVDDVQIFDRVLSPTEVDAIYSAGN
ncbi:MAG: LamG domain-containing protein [Halorientalis sp.]